MSWRPLRVNPQDGKPRWIWTKRSFTGGKPEVGLAYYTQSMWHMAVIQDGQPRFEIVDPALIWSGDMPPEPTPADIEALK